MSLVSPMQLAKGDKQHDRILGGGVVWRQATPMYYGEPEFGANLPAHWFNSPTPILDAIITGLASTLAFVYSLIQYAKSQTRN